MKYLLALAFGVLPFFSFSQTVDTAAVVRQVDSLVQLCRTLTGQGKYDDALQVIEMAKKKAGETFGVESAGYASCIFNQGRVFAFWGKFDDAEPLYLEAKAIREKVLGKEHPDYAHSLNNLAIVYQGKGEYDKAVEAHLEAKTIRKKVLGNEHPDYIRSLNNLATVYHDKGDYDKAVELHLEAKTIRKKVLGNEHPDYAQSLNNLAVVYLEKGEYDKAELLFLEAKTIREKKLGKEHPNYAASLNNLALVYRAKGEYDKAVEVHLEAKVIREKVLGNEHPDYTYSLNNLASAYWSKGEYDKAELLFLEAKTIQDKVLGKEHPYYANSLNNLAIIYHDKGDYDKAVELHLEAKTIREKVLGKKHPDYARSLNSLAIVYKDKGDYDKALELHLEAKAIWEKVLGKEYSDYAMSLDNLALVYRDKGDPINAASYFHSSNTATKSLLQKDATYSSEREMLRYQALSKKRFDILLYFTQTHPTDSLISTAYDNALFLNNALLFNAVAREKSIAQADSDTRSIHSEWKSCHFQLAKQYALPIAERKSELVARLEEKANDLEKELVRRSPDFAATRQVIFWQDVRERLRPGEVAIEFINYRCETRKTTDSIMYAALLLRSGDKSPLMIPLFEEKLLAALLDQPQSGKADFINKLYGSPALHDLVWKPLLPWLDGVGCIYFSPSGLLHRLSLEAIFSPSAENQNVTLHRLGSTRQLVTDNPASTFAAGDAVVFGGVRYEMDSSAIAAANRNLPLEETGAPGSLNSFRGGGSGSAWGYLTFTEIEAKSVAELLAAAGASVQIRQGYSATEESFAILGKKSAAPKVLHLATHAFFFPDPGIRDEGRGMRDDEPVFKMSEHPMMRSGLVLAGANQAWLTGKPLEGMEDGILTAYEISQMNLGGTELVVLSACETGLGDIEGNEGVYGLQRAFKIAGAKYLVMSLWKVPDYQTEALMNAFYTEWLEGKKSIPEAFRSAQLRMKSKYPDEPFNWAGFVLVE